MAFVYEDTRHQLQSKLLGLTEAAKRFGISRRTLDRWIRDGRLASTPSTKDKRQRLVDPDEVAVVVQQMPRRGLNRAVVQSPSDAESMDIAPTAEAKPVPNDVYLEVIDDVLQLVYSQYRRMCNRLHPESFRELTLEQLRNGPLGRDSRRLAELARGESRERQDMVVEVIDAILEVLFWPVAAEDYTVPRTFWDTEFGRMLTQAKYRAFKPEELMSIGAAAEFLGVTRPTIYRWMDDHTINWVRDDFSGRTFAVRRDVHDLKRVADRLAEEQAALDRAKAR